jgi:hypothetical protein
MVTFGSYPLQHVSNVRVQETRVLNERLIPGATVGHRKDQTAGGRIVTVAGEIRNDPDYVLRLEELRVRQDDVARELDLEDGSASITAKLGPVEATWTVEEGVERPMYSAVFYETS